MNGTHVSEVRDALERLISAVTISGYPITPQSLADAMACKVESAMHACVFGVIDQGLPADGIYAFLDALSEEP